MLAAADIAASRCRCNGACILVSRLGRRSRPASNVPIGSPSSRPGTVCTRAALKAARWGSQLSRQEAVHALSHRSLCVRTAKRKNAQAAARLATELLNAHSPATPPVSLPPGRQMCHRENSVQSNRFRTPTVPQAKHPWFVCNQGGWFVSDPWQPSQVALALMICTRLVCCAAATAGGSPAASTAASLLHRRHSTRCCSALALDPSILCVVAVGDAGASSFP